MGEAESEEPHERICIYCYQSKPTSDFGYVNRGTRGNRCTTCLTGKRMLKSSRNVEQFLRTLHTKSKSSRKKSKYEWRIETEHIIDLWYEQKGRCAISGVFMTHHFDRGAKKEYNASIDRIRSTDDYTFDNIQLVTHRVNILKNDLDEASLYWWIKTIHDYNCD